LGRKMQVEYLLESLNISDSYPLDPISIVNCFSVGNSSLLGKKCLVYYFLIDFSEENGLQYDSFADRFLIPISNRNLIKCLYLLDTLQFDSNLISLLFDPSILIEWTPQILKLLTDYGQFSLALKFIRSKKPSLNSVQDIMIYINVLLQNKLFHEAYLFLKTYKNKAKPGFEDLFNFFLNCCEQTHQLQILFELPMNNEEEEYFENYLQQPLSTPHSFYYLDILLFYYLQKGKLNQAKDIYENLIQNDMNQEQNTLRKSMIDNYEKVYKNYA